MIDTICEIGKNKQQYDTIVEIEKFNPYHDSRGRFSSANGATSFTYAPGKSKAHDNAIQRDMVIYESANFGKTDAKTFASAVASARSNCPEDKRWRVDAHSEKELTEDYAGAKFHVTKKGSTVAVTADGDIISVCKNPGDNLSGKDLMKIATENGGVKLDSFSGNHGFYTKCGFEPVSWTPFNEAYAPAGWRKGVDSPEPVVFYKYTGKKVTTTLKDFLASTKPFEGEDGYYNAMVARDKEITR